MSRLLDATSAQMQEVIQPFRVIIHRCQRFYFHTGQKTFRAVPPMPGDFQQTVASRARLARSLFQQQESLQQQPQQEAWQQDQRQLLEAELFSSPSDRIHRTLWYGPNETRLPVKDLQTMITEELLQPLYVSQVHPCPSPCWHALP